MRKFLYSMLAVAMVSFAACTHDEEFKSVTDGEVEATFSINVPAGMETRAIGDGTTVDVVACAVLKADGDELTSLRITDLAVNDKMATYTIRLAKGQSYRIAFFAYNSTTAAYDVTDMKDVKVLDNQLSNQEGRDAFTAYVDITADESMEPVNKDVTLTRPFAQLNLGALAEDIEAAAKAGIVIKKTKVTVSGVYTSFNAYNNVVNDGTEERVFEYNVLPNQTLEANNGTYSYLALNHILVNEKTLHDVTFQWITTDDETDPATKTNNPVTVWNNVPLERNFRTNILGYLLSNPAQFNITIDSDFEENDHNEPWVGAVSEPAYNAVTQTYTVNSAEELAWIVQQVNGTTEYTRAAAETNDFAGQTILLGGDIDLHNYPWTPIGTSTEKAFCGTFDGNNFAISNLSVKGIDYAAFIAYAGENATVKNLRLENVNISSTKHAAGAVCIAGNGLTLENVSVSGSIVAVSYAGGILHYADNATIKDCENAADVTANRAAGIAAWVTVGTNIENASNEGNITGAIGASGIAHGFAGSIKHAANSGTITSSGTEPAAGIAGVQKAASTYEYCYNNGTVKTTANNPNSSAAGILGQTPGTAATLSYCANYGDITAENSYAAGIAYSLYGSVNASYCYNSGIVDGGDGAGAITPKAQFGTGDRASYCLNDGSVTSADGMVYQASNNTTSCYYYSNDELLNTSDNSPANEDDALAVLNSGSDNGFFTTSNGKIVVE